MNPATLNRRNDSDLLRLVAASHEIEPFEALVLRHELPVYRFAYLLTGCPATAERWTVDVFGRLYRETAAFMRQLPLGHALFAAILNHAESQQRGTGRWRLGRSRAAGMPAEIDTSEAGSNWRSGGADRMGHRLLMEALASLKDHHRAALALCEYEGLSYAEAAAIMNTSHSAIRSWTQRARLVMAQSATTVEALS